MSPSSSVMASEGATMMSVTPALLSLSVHLGDWHRPHLVDEVSPAPPNPSPLSPQCGPLFSPCQPAVQQQLQLHSGGAALLVASLLLFHCPLLRASFNRARQEPMRALSTPQCIHSRHQSGSSMPLAIPSPLTPSNRRSCRQRLKRG